MPTPGKLISVEGGEGLGKSTNIETICGLLSSQGIKIYRTREPGGTEFSERCRSLLLEKYDAPIDAIAELLLIFAARRQHIIEVITPKLQEGIWVVSDRFTDASYAYQGYGRHVDLNHIQFLERMVQSDLKPDLTILLDAPVELSMERLARRGQSIDRIEAEQHSFFDRVRDGYLALARQYPERVAVVDATRSIEHVRNDVTRVLTAFIHKVVASV